MQNSLGMELVEIPPGTFAMGREEGGDADERPVHQVAIARSFHMGVTPVTNAQYEQFDPAHRSQRNRRGLSGEDDEAILFVSWRDAVKPGMIPAPERPSPTSRATIQAAPSPASTPAS